MRALSPFSRAYIAAVTLLATLLLVWHLPHLPDSTAQWATLGVLAVCASIAQLFPVVTPKNQAYYVTLVFIFAGVLLLPAGALALLVVVAFVPEWIKGRGPGYIQLFNIGNFLVNVFAARWVYLWAGGVPGGENPYPVGLLAAVLAVAVFALSNHLLLAIVLHLARGHSLRDTRLFEAESLLTDAALACTGIITSLLWVVNPWLVSLVIALLFLVYRALNTPNLLEQARTDEKTGLYNTRYFEQVLREEIRRARRFDRPLSVIMADMDLLRDINNSYGHLAGDAVLKRVARIIRGGLREYDVAARFGGEEFSILLPETDAEQAFAVAERIRKQVEETRFALPPGDQAVRVTLSLGISSLPAHGAEPNELIHRADLAVYRSKLLGRNRSCVGTPDDAAWRPVEVAPAHLTKTW